MSSDRQCEMQVNLRLSISLQKVRRCPVMPFLLLSIGLSKVHHVV